MSVGALVDRFDHTFPRRTNPCQSMTRQSIAAYQVEHHHFTIIMFPLNNRLAASTMNTLESRRQLQVPNRPLDQPDLNWLSFLRSNRHDA
jgi:hypothetical protein